MHFFSFYRPTSHQDLPSFPTRRSSDLAILSKLQSGDVRVVDQLKFDEPKTKLMAQVYKALGIDRSCLFALAGRDETLDRKSTRLNSSHVSSSYAVFCLKKKTYTYLNSD